jgi:ribulose-phosphate 3-epimerase
MADVVPAVLAETPEQYQHDLDVATSLRHRVQVDLVDGEFADNRTINLIQTYWPEEVRIDMHLMYNDPVAHVSTIIAQQPYMAIIHIEAAGLRQTAIWRTRERLQMAGIQFGIALLPDTPVSRIEPYMPWVDHVLVFTGELGHYGGQLRFDCLDKIDQIKHRHADIEVGVDGGITDETAAQVTEAGADVLNVGGFIQNATHPETAYATLKEIVERQKT